MYRPFRFFHVLIACSVLLLYLPAPASAVAAPSVIVEETASAESPIWYCWGPGLPDACRRGLMDLTFDAFNDGWAVGQYGVILHWNGTSWRSFPSPTERTLNDVTIVPGTNGTDAWAVGDAGTLLRWDGSSWSIVGSPVTEYLVEVDAVSSTDVWVASSSGSMLHWNGASWTNTGDLGSVYLRSLDMVSTSDGWVMGSGGVIYRWRGFQWESVTSPTTQDLYAVAMVSATDGWAVGVSGTILRWNGVAWNTWSSPATGTLVSVSMSAPDDGWAYQKTYPGAILHWDGANWSTATTPDYGLEAIAAAPGVAPWIVGHYGEIYRWDDNAWIPIVGPPAAQSGWARAIKMVSATDGWLGGDSRGNMHWNGNQWITFNSQPAMDLDFVSATNGWAVGNLQHWNGAQWQSVANPTTTSLYGVSMVSATDGWAVGGDAINTYGGGVSEILRWNGVSWSRFPSPLPKATQVDEILSSQGVSSPSAQIPHNVLDDVDMVTSQLGWAVGTYGVILHWNGYSWSIQTSPTTMHLRSVEMLSAYDGWAVGGNGYGTGGTILRWNGSHWNIVSSPVTTELSSIDMLSSTEGWAAGNGSILHWNGVAWHSVSIPAGIQVSAIGMASASDGWAQGNGVLLRYGIPPEPGYQLSGYVRDQEGNPISGVLITTEDGSNASTDAGGFYAINEIHSGSHILTPSKVGYAFSTCALPVEITDADVTGQDFIGFLSPLLTEDVPFFGERSLIYLAAISDSSLGIAQDGDFFVNQLQIDEATAIVESMFNIVNVMAPIIKPVQNLKDATKLQMPGVVGRGWDYLIGARERYEAVMLAFSPSLFSATTSSTDDIVARHLLNGALTYFALDTGESVYDGFVADQLIKYNWDLALRHELALETELYPKMLELSNSYYADIADLSMTVQTSDLCLTPAQAEIYSKDLLARQQAHIEFYSLVERHALTLEIARSAREFAENYWIQELLFLNAFKTAALVAMGPPGAVAIQTGVALYTLVADAIEHRYMLDQDVQMMALATDSLSGAWHTQRQLYVNTVHGLDNMIQGIEPEIAQATIDSVVGKSIGEYKLFNNWWWCERDSYTEVTLTKKEPDYDTDFEGFAMFEKDAYAGAIDLIVDRGVGKIEIADTGVITIPHRLGDIGDSPEEKNGGDVVEVAILGSTDTGTYYIGRTSYNWDPDRIPEDGADSAIALGPSEEPVLTLPYPIRQAVIPHRSDLAYIGRIWVDNPFTYTLATTVTQALPTEVAVVEVGSGVLEGQTLSWTQNISPETTTELTYTVRYSGMGGDLVVFPEAVLLMSDGTNAAEFTGREIAVTAPALVTASGMAPTHVAPGHSASVPMTLTNHTDSQLTAHISLRCLTRDGAIVSEYNDDIEINGRTSLAHIATLTVPTDEDIYVLRAYVDAAEGRYEILASFVDVSLEKVYLPLVAHCR